MKDIERRDVLGLSHQNNWTTTVTSISDFELNVHLYNGRLCLGELTYIEFSESGLSQRPYLRIFCRNSNGS